MVLALSMTAAVVDLRTRRIPNLLVLPAIVAGLALALVQAPRLLLLRSIAVIVVLIAGMFLFSAGIVGGGDGKLVAAIAALKGFVFTAETILYALLAGGLVSLIVLIRKRNLRAGLMRAVSAVAGGQQGEAFEGTHIPFAPIIALGVIVAVATSAAGWHITELFA